MFRKVCDLKRGYLSRQALDIFISLKTFAGNSRYVLLSRYYTEAPMSRATFDHVTYLVVELAKKGAAA
jgi:hypothetical protein